MMCISEATVYSINECVKIIKDDLLNIMDNCLNDKKRAVKNCERTKRLRKEYSRNYEEKKNILMAVITNIETLRNGQCVSLEHKEYAETIERLAVESIVGIIRTNWIKDDEKNIGLEQWRNIVTELKDTSVSNGKILEREEIYNYIKQSLFSDWIEQKNRFWGYFINGKRIFSNEETKNELLTDDSFNGLWAVYFGCVSDQIVMNDKIKLHRKKWVEYHKNRRFLLNAEDYISYVICDATEQCEGGVKIQESNELNDFEKYLDAIMLSQIVRSFKMFGALVWELENWMGISVNIKNGILDLGNQKIRPIVCCVGEEFDYTKLSFEEKVRIMVKKKVFSEEIMRQWLLIPLLDRLVADDLTMAENNGVNTRAETTHCINIAVELDRNERAIFDGTNIIHQSRNKQGKRKNDDAEEPEFWTVYKHQKSCFEYLLGTGDDKRILFLGKSAHIRADQSFQDMRKHFEGVHLEQERYIDDYYLNQFIHFDSAVEFVYGISRMMKVTKKTATNLKEELVKVSNVVVAAQRIIKCGIGMIIHECFALKVSEFSEEKQYTESECKEFLLQLAETIKENIIDTGIKDIQNSFYQELLQNSWYLMKENPLVHRGEIEFTQDFFATLNDIISEYGMSRKNEKKYKEDIRAALYDKNIRNIMNVLKHEWRKEIPERLKISSKAWRYVVESFPDIQGNNSGRDKYSILYKTIQNSLINANYQ